MTDHTRRRPPSDMAIYSITTASELVGVGVQSLRLYEAKGLLAPERSAGGTRKYSDDDITIGRRVAALLAEGVNLVGVRRILDLEDANHALRDRLRQPRRRT